LNKDDINILRAAQKGLNEPIATTAYGMSKVGLTAGEKNNRIQPKCFENYSKFH
jgi:hypothetical protein